MSYFDIFLRTLKTFLGDSPKDTTALRAAIENAVQQTWTLRTRNRLMKNPYDVSNDSCKFVRDAWRDVIIEIQMLDAPEHLLSTFRYKHKFWSDQDLRKDIGDGTFSGEAPATIERIEDSIDALLERIET